MIVDACIFAGEMDMLKFRMAILNPVVDCFVVVQNLWTHQNKPQKLVSLDQYPKVKSFYLNLRGDGYREIEIQQRDLIKDCCDQFREDDLLILSDMDEIPSRESVRTMKELSMPRTCELDFYYYRLNWRRPEKCSLIMSTIKHLREVGGESLRGLRGTPPKIDVQPSGWHLSYFGGTEAIQKKLSTFCHSEFNKPEFMDKDWLEECQRTGKGLLKCGTQCLESTPKDFPKYFVDAAPKGWWL